MLLLVERAGVEETADDAPARNAESHCFPKDIADDRQEDDRDENDLRFEVVDFLQNGCKDGESTA